MKQKEREIRQRLKAKRDAAQQFLDNNQIEEARSATDEAEEINQELEVYLRINAIEPGEVAPVVPSIAAPENENRSNEQDDEKKYRNIFMKVLRNKPLNAEEREIAEQRIAETRAMTGATEEDGGLIIPKDMQTKIHERRRAFFNLDQFVNIEPVGTRSGTRVFEKYADITPFQEINENGPIGETDSPKFTPSSYNVKDRGGILPLSRSLLADTDQNLQQYVEKWIGKKSAVTRNVLILAVIEQLQKQKFENLDKIKAAINIDLDPAITESENFIFLTNQHGFNFLDQQKDAEGKALLQPDPTQPTKKLLYGYPVVKAPTRFFKNTEDAVTGEVIAPLVFGDLKEAITLYDREEYELKTTDTGGDSFKRNTLDMRVIQREDVKLLDDGAAIYGQLVITPAA